MRLDLQVDLVQDEASRDNFDVIQQRIEDNALLKFDAKFLIFSVNASGTHLIGHGLTGKPLDLLVTAKTGSGNYTFLFDEFDKTYIKLSTTGPVKIRCFVGTFAEERYENLDL